MYRQIKPKKTSIKRNESYHGVALERKIERMITNKEPIGDGAEITYTERKNGVHPEMDIRTDRWEHAVEARDKTAKSKIATREQAIGERSWDTMTDDQKREFKTKFPNSKFEAPQPNQGT